MDIYNLRFALPGRAPPAFSMVSEDNHVIDVNPDARTVEVIVRGLGLLERLELWARYHLPPVVANRNALYGMSRVTEPALSIIKKVAGYVLGLDTHNTRWANQHVINLDPPVVGSYDKVVYNVIAIRQLLLQDACYQAFTR